MKLRYVKYTKTGLLLELKRLHSIIKEVRDYTNDLLKLKENDYFDLVDKSYIKKYLEILDKSKY